MQTELSEYIPSPNEHRKKFDIVPSQDPVDLTAIKIRTQCLRDRNLTYGARCLFCFLLDQALNPYVHVVKGVVAISATRLAEYLGCYEKSIFPWIEDLARGGYLWQDQQFMPNFWAMNRYHICVFDPQDQPQQLATRDGMWGNGVRRPAAPKGGYVAGGVGKTTRQNAVENLQQIENQPEAGEFSTRPTSEKPPASGVENPPLRQVEKPPLRAVENPPAAQVEKQSARVVKTTHIRESQIQFQRRNQSSENSSKGLKPARKGENDFLERMGQCVHEFGGPKALMLETKNFGKQWRMCYREDPDRAERAFLDAKADLKEGKIAKSFGATWRIRWNEFQSRKAGK